MKWFQTSVVVISFVLLPFFCVPAWAQTQQLFVITDPYNNITRPFDPTRRVYGKTQAEVCGQRTVAELTNFGSYPTLFFAGYSSDCGPNTCDIKWINTGHGGDAVVTTCTLTMAAASCQELLADPAGHPNIPQECVAQVPTPKNAGQPCPSCGNSINPGTGNKYQAETDLAPVTAGGLSLTRYYNTGRSAPLTQDLGGFWQHNYHTRIILSAADQALYYAPDGKVLTFRLVGGAWIPDADIADVLIELKDANGRTTGWKYTKASNDDVVTFAGTGRPISIQNRAGLITTLTDTDGTSGPNGGFVLDAQGNPTTEVLPRGLLLRVTDPFGRTLQFGYDSASRVIKVTDPAGSVIRYGYGIHRTLTSVTYQDGTTQRQYRYNEPAHTGGANLPNNLTGIEDENETRLATFAYDQLGRATKTTYHAGGNEVQRYTLTYSGNQTTITDPLGTARPNLFATKVGVVKQTSETQPTADGQSTATRTIDYDANGNVASRTDFNGNRTDYPEYDLTRNLEKKRIEAVGTLQERTIHTDWHPTFRLPVKIAEPLRVTTFAYGPDGSQCEVPGALCSKTIQATEDTNGSQGLSVTPVGTPRTWTYTYNANGDVLTVDGPRTDAGVVDVTEYHYYANDASCPTGYEGGHPTGCRGQVEWIRNAAGHRTTIAAYNAHGQPIAIEDPNGLVTLMGYDERLRLVTRKIGDEPTTTYEYYGTGQLKKVTLPDNSSLSYEYDSAQRLTQISDNLLNRIVYPDVDAMGNWKREEIHASGQLVQKRTREFNLNVNRVSVERGGQGEPGQLIAQYGYDNQGNVTSVIRPNTPPSPPRTTTYDYDKLNRLEKVTSPWPTSAVTNYEYNGLDALTKVTQFRALPHQNLITTYTVNGLGNLTLQTSPDTLNTENTYDAAGNLRSQKDAKNQVTTYDYDALNRVTLITFQDSSKQIYTYDEGPNGIGRLTGIVERNPVGEVTSRIAYGYDKHGRIISDTRTVNGVHVTTYRYDSAGRLDQITYPSGRVVTYSFDGVGRVSQIAAQTAGQAQNWS